MLIWLWWSVWNSFVFFLVFALCEWFKKSIFFNSWWVVNETSRFLNPSSNSYFILFIFSLLMIFSLSSSNISVACCFPNSLDTDSFKNTFKVFFLLLVWLRWSIWYNFIFSLGKRLFTLTKKMIFFGERWIVNESSVSLNFSSYSNSVLLVFGLLMIFGLGGGNISIASSFPSSLNTNSF